MSLNPPNPRLKVLHNSISAEKVEIVVPPGDVLEVSPYVAAQLVAARGTGFQADADELAKGLAAEKEFATAVEAERIAPKPEPVKKAAKRAATDRD